VLVDCDIEPFNPNIFSDHDFASAEVTERPFNEEQSIPGSSRTIEHIQPA